MAKEKAVYCWNCACMRRHTYVGRERGGIIKEVVLGVVSLGWNPLINLAMGKSLGGTKFWECTQCGHINEED